MVTNARSEIKEVQKQIAYYFISAEMSACWCIPQDVLSGCYLSGATLRAGGIAANRVNTVTDHQSMGDD